MFPSSYAKGWRACGREFVSVVVLCGGVAPGVLLVWATEHGVSNKRTLDARAKPDDDDYVGSRTNGSPRKLPLMKDLPRQFREIE